VTAAAASITAPTTAVGGSTVEIGWTGPDYDNDYIGIGRADAEGGAQWANYTYTNQGSPLDLELPTEPGDYIVRYFVQQDRSVLAEAPITVTAASATITAPTTAVGGSTVEIGWTGPDYDNDYIGIGRADAEGGEQWANYTYTNQGSPLDLLVPTEPGDYVIRYFVNQDRRVLAEAPLGVSAASATLTAPATAAAGSTIEVGWTGPGYQNDYIGIGRAGARDGARWQSYTRTSQGNPLSLDLPDEPGDYVIRYFIDQDRSVLAEVPITLQ